MYDNEWQWIEAFFFRYLSNNLSYYVVTYSTVLVAVDRVVLNDKRISFFAKRYIWMRSILFLCMNCEPNILMSNANVHEIWIEISRRWQTTKGYCHFNLLYLCFDSNSCVLLAFICAQMIIDSWKEKNRGKNARTLYVTFGGGREKRWQISHQTRHKHLKLRLRFYIYSHTLFVVIC